MARENLENILVKIEKHLSHSDRLVRVLESLDRKLSGSSKGIEKTFESIENLGSSAKKSKTYIDDFGETSRKTSLYIRRFGEGLKDSISRLKEFIKDSFTVGKSLLSFDTNLNKIGYSLRYVGYYGSKLNTFMSILGASLETIQYYIDALKEVTLSTVEFKDGMSGIIIAASRAGMTLENYAKFLENYSGAVNRYGLPSTLRMIEGLRSNAKELYLMGLSVSEVNDYFGSFLEQQRVFDNRRIRTEAELQDMFKDQMKMTYEMAAVTGKSFSEVFRSITEKFKDPRTAAILQLLTEESRKEFLKFIEMFPSLENIMLTSVQKGAVQFSDEFSNYATSVMPELIEISEGLKSGTIDANTAYKIMRDSIKNISEDQMRLFALQGENVHSAVSRLIIEVNKINEKFGRINKEDSVDGISAALLQIENSMIYFSSQIRTKFLEMLIGKKTPDEVERIFKQGQEKISNALDNFMNSLEKLLSTISGEPGTNKTGLEMLIDLLTTMITSVSDFVKWLSNSENLKLVNNFFFGLYEIFKNITEFVKENPMLSLAGGILLFNSVKKLLWFLGKGLLGLGIGAFNIASWGFDIAKTALKRKIEAKKLAKENAEIQIDEGDKKTDGDKVENKKSTHVKEKLTRGLKNIWKFGKTTIPGLAIGLGTEAATSTMEEGETKELTKSILEGAGIGAAIGGITGSIIPFIGTAIGTAIGGTAGGLIGASDLIKKNFIDKIDEINKDIQDVKLPPSASLEKSYEELKNINKGISNIEKQFAELNKFSRENALISGAILKENKESNEKIENFVTTTFFDNLA